MGKIETRETFTVEELCAWLAETGRAESAPHKETIRAKIRAGKIKAEKRQGKGARGRGGEYVISREEAEKITIRGRGRPRKGE